MNELLANVYDTFETVKCGGPMTSFVQAVEEARACSQWGESHCKRLFSDYCDEPTHENYKRVVGAMLVIQSEG